MKEAMWGVGLLVMGLLGIVMINLFGNITVTNQFDYTTMKNAMQAAMLDSLSIAYYRAGFCVCTTDGSAISGTKAFTDKGQYTLMDIVDDKCADSSGEEMANCSKVYGDYRLDPELFDKNLKDRFSRMITNNKDYDIEVKEVIEYPPKASIVITSHDEEFSPTEKDSGGYNIVNTLDGIIEVK